MSDPQCYCFQHSVIFNIFSVLFKMPIIRHTNISDPVNILPSALNNTLNDLDPVNIPPSELVNTADMLDTVIILPTAPANVTNIFDTEMNSITTDGIPREALLSDSSPNDPTNLSPYLRRFPLVP